MPSHILLGVSETTPHPIRRDGAVSPPRISSDQGRKMDRARHRALGRSSWEKYGDTKEENESGRTEHVERGKGWKSASPV